ncbi:MAG TPA: MoaD/ThiS family protein [Mycobacteriales bacterium]|nr:MoaD/ThiS family protein [Mycobacteriales bacterium]
MTVQVKIPTILRSYTGGEKSVEASGETLDAVFSDLESRHSGLKARLVAEGGGLHKFVNIYVDDEDVRFLGGLEAPVKDGQTVTILPAVAGG